MTFPEPVEFVFSDRNMTRALIKRLETTLQIAFFCLPRNERVWIPISDFGS